MPTRIDLEQFREEITALINSRAEQAAVREHLKQEHGINIGRTRLQKALVAWGLRRNRSLPSTAEGTPLLRDRIEYFFRKLRYTDEQTAACLKLEGMDVDAVLVRHMRKEMGLVKKVPRELHELEDTRITELLRQEYMDGTITDFGKGRLYNTMRLKHGIVGRNRMYQAARRLMPEAFERRRQRRDRVVQPRQADGPDHVWSMDAHCKLEPWGIYIYGAIDVYSRHIIWLHAGIAARTGTSVLAQYLRAVRALGRMPQILRVDCGAEAPITGAVHHALSNLVRIRPGEQELAAEDVFHQGTSKKNNRIEQYWGQQAKAALNGWRQWFIDLTANGGYRDDLLVDRIAFRAIYMPLIRQALNFFKDNVHDNYKVRKQSTRPNAIPAAPEGLYQYPELFGAENCGFDISSALLAPFEQRLDSYDLEEYLPPITKAWCEQSLRGAGFAVPVTAEGWDVHERKRHHELAYYQLRGSIQRHMNNVNDPVLEESYIPYAGDWTHVFDTLTAAPAAHVDANNGLPDDMSYVIED